MRVAPGVAGVGPTPDAADRRYAAHSRARRRQLWCDARLIALSASGAALFPYACRHHHLWAST